MKEILEILADSDLGKENTRDFDEVIEKLELYYSVHKRHKYSEITKYVLDVCRETNDGEHIEVILDNLNNIINIIESKCVCEHNLKIDECRKLDPPQFGCKAFNCGKCYSNMKNIYRKLNKLYDHIYLEFLRIMDIRQTNDTSLFEMDRLSNKLEDSEKLLKNTATQAARAERKLASTNRKVNRAQKEYITILGIFASIVLAFTGGIAFSTSILENINAISPYRLAAVVIGLAFVLINVIYLLVWFILEINKTDEQKNNYPKFMIVINCILVIAIIITLVMWNINYNVNDSKSFNEKNISTEIEHNKLDKHKRPE